MIESWSGFGDTAMVSVCEHVCDKGAWSTFGDVFAVVVGEFLMVMCTCIVAANVSGHELDDSDVATVCVSRRFDDCCSFAFDVVSFVFGVVWCWGVSVFCGVWGSCVCA